MGQPMFVDQDTVIHTGDEAAIALERVSDREFLSDGKGVVAVSKDRWRAAQTYEHQTWMAKAGTHATEDRNHDHFLQFDGYGCLEGMEFSHAIELGCGPFTNLRYIMRACKIRECTLLDPLASSYLEHRHCNYDADLLRGDPTPLNIKLSGNVLFRGIRRLIRKVAPSLLYATVPVRQIIPRPIEEMPAGMKYDLIVIINVIEHCYDANLIFDKIREMASERAIIVFHDKYYYHDRVSDDVQRVYDAGHPLRVDREVVDDFLGTNFTSLFKKLGRRQSIVAGIDIGYDTVYYIGRLRELSPIKTSPGKS